ncbi:MAG: hypothetical protein R2794_03660 [Chitinophagales bacterium]
MFLGLYVGWKLGNIQLAALQFIAIALLYLYSSFLKKVTLAGNVVVAFLAGLSILFSIIFEPHLYQLQRPGDYFVIRKICNMIVAVAAFAAALTLVREVVKDMEDRKEMHPKTRTPFRCVWGMLAAVLISMFF